MQFDQFALSTVRTVCAIVLLEFASLLRVWANLHDNRKLLLQTGLVYNSNSLETVYKLTNQNTQNNLCADSGKPNAS